MGKSFTKSGHDLTVDLSDCVNDVQISSLQFCSDQDEIHATVVKSFVRVEVPLVRSSCSSVGATTCTGSGDPPSAAPFCFTGSKLGETENLKVNTFASEAGGFDLTGSGLESISFGKVVYEERAESCCRFERLRVSGHDFKARVSTFLTRITLSPPSRTVSSRRTLC